MNGTCSNIEVGLDGCQVSINGAPIINTTNVVMDGLRIRWSGSRVRIAVPNCVDTMLVMWVFCNSGRVENPVTWEYYYVNFI